MDKQEQREIIGEIKKAYARGDFDRVLTFADEMNIRKLADSRTLEMVADAHAAKGELEDAREILLSAMTSLPKWAKIRLTSWVFPSKRASLSKKWKRSWRSVL